LNIGLTMLGSYATSSHNVYLWVKDNEGDDTGWVQTGTWSPAVAQPVPSVVSGSPTSTTAVSQTFTFVARDTAGYSDISRINFLINSSATTPANLCYGFYDRGSNAFYLYNDGGTATTGPLSPGSGTLQNGQCSLAGSASGVVSTSGTDITLNIGLTMLGTYATSSHNVYLSVKDNEGDITGWIQTGTWSPAVSTSKPSVVSGSPTSTTSLSQTFSFVARDPAGYSDIYRIYFLINNSATIPANTCHGFYDRPSNTFYLYNDALTAAMGPLTPGSGTLQNSQCALNGSTSSLVSVSGTDATLNIGLTMLGTYATSSHNVYLWVKDNEGDDTGWIQTGTWSPTVASPAPSVVSGSPTSTTSVSQTFTFVGRDAAGYSDIYRIYFLINSSPTIPANTCHGFYDRPSNTLYLYNDAVTAAMGPLTPGSSSVLQNSQCRLNGATSQVVSTSGTDITLNIGLTVLGSYVGTSHNVYLWVKDSQGIDTGWVQTGTWF
jgi:uncharacterized membrane protein YqaE (UPF0057 family)